jgi:DNA-binding GntR family transcriptional regulator
MAEVKPRADELAGEVRDRILSGSIVAESWIKQDALAAELGVSKIPLREALRKLEHEGLITSEVNRGFFVRPLRAAEAEEIFALRLKLEPDAIADGALAATVSDQAVAKDALARLRDSIDSHGMTAGALNRAFHIALMAPSAQPLTLGILERLHILSERYVAKHLEPAERAPRANSEHETLLRAWLRRDAGAARRIALDHIARTLAELRTELTR